MKNILVLGAIFTLSSAVYAQEFDLNSLAQEGIIGASSNEYVAAFAELDSDKDGFLSEEELLKFQEVGLAQEKDETYKMLDFDGNGKVNEKEYKDFFNIKAPQNIGGADLSLIFNDMDSDNDGNLSPEELKTYRQKNLSVQNREVFRLIDINNDNKISEEEFAKFMNLTKSILGNIKE